ncbi:MAG: hypothetical protein QNJ92_17410 [Alphaproteobacteria bacterium]|nr:hypothetical protein [Alphaproteobacteria bacterium]
MTKVEDKQRDEFRKAYQHVKADTPLIEPTEDEKRNGWTAETLTEYLREQKAAQALRMDPHSLSRRMARRPDMQNHRYSPLRWRR